MSEPIHILFQRFKTPMSNMLRVQIAESPKAAPNYRRDSIDIRAAVITRAIVVKNGTESGAPTVDFQIIDPDGGEFVAMLTGQIVKQLGTIVAATETDDEPCADMVCSDGKAIETVISELRQSVHRHDEGTECRVTTNTLQSWIDQLCDALKP